MRSVVVTWNFRRITGRGPTSKRWKSPKAYTHEGENGYTRT